MAWRYLDRLGRDLGPAWRFIWVGGAPEHWPGARRVTSLGELHGREALGQRSSGRHPHAGSPPPWPGRTPRPAGAPAGHDPARRRTTPDRRPGPRPTDHTAAHPVVQPRRRAGGRRSRLIAPRAPCGRSGARCHGGRTRGHRRSRRRSSLLRPARPPARRGPWRGPGCDACRKPWAARRSRTMLQVWRPVGTEQGTEATAEEARGRRPAATRRGCRKNAVLPLQGGLCRLQPDQHQVRHRDARGYTDERARAGYG